MSIVQLSAFNFNFKTHALFLYTQAMSIKKVSSLKDCAHKSPKISLGFNLSNKNLFLLHDSRQEITVFRSLSHK
jgi:hypothetical protein